MSDSITTQIVGAHFRPPAKALLACLPAGHPLLLRPEPTNEWDENAVQVLLRSDSLHPLLSEPFIKDELERQLAGQGADVELVLAEPEWHLGYLPKAAKGNHTLQEWNQEVQKAIHEVCLQLDEVSGDDPAVVACSLSFDSAGKPTCIIPWSPVPAIADNSVTCDGDIGSDSIGAQIANDPQSTADGTLPPAGELQKERDVFISPDGRRKKWFTVSRELLKPYYDR